MDIPPRENYIGKMVNFFKNILPKDEIPIIGKQPKLKGIVTEQERVRDGAGRTCTWNGLPAYEYKVKGQSGKVKAVSMGQYINLIENPKEDEKKIYDKKWFKDTFGFIKPPTTNKKVKAKKQKDNRGDWFQ